MATVALNHMIVVRTVTMACVAVAQAADPMGPHVHIVMIAALVAMTECAEGPQVVSPMARAARKVMSAVMVVTMEFVIKDE